MNPASGKFILTRTPALPAKCAGCGNDAKGDKEFVDMNLSLDWYGAVVFCIDCASEISNLIGFVSANVIIEMDDDLHRALANNVEIGRKLEALESVVSAYRFGGTVIDDQLSLDLVTGEDENARIKHSTATKSGPFK